MTASTGWRTRTTDQRFDSKVDRRDPDECWLWTGARYVDGYGYFCVASRQKVRAHRFAYERTHGPIPADRMIDHACRVRHCVNPGHLRLATPVQNAANAPARGGRSEHKGVSWHQAAHRWQVSIRHHGRSHHLGLFDTEAEAALAYNGAALAAFGEFAYLNEVPS